METLEPSSSTSTELLLSNSPGRTLGSNSASDQIDSQLEEITDVLKELYGLGSSLLNAAPHDRITDPLFGKISQAIRPVDLQFIRTRLPKASEEVVTLLAKANSRRRARLVYYKQKHEASLKPMEESNFDGQELMVMPTSASNIARLILSPSGSISIGDKGLGLSSDPGSNSLGASLTAPTPKLKQETAQRFPVPKPPEGYYQNLPLDCPYCFSPLSHTRKPEAWE